MQNNPFLPKPYKIIDIVKETDLEYTFKVENDKIPNHGQFFQVSIPRVGEAPISVSNFGDDFIEMTIRKVGTVTNVLHSLDKGDNIFLRGPYGNGFPIDQFYNKHLVIATGGTGLAPVRSIINHFHSNIKSLKKFDLLMGFKNPQSIVFLSDIERWKKNINVTLTVDDACGIWGECVGLITEYVKKVNLSEFNEMEVIVVGPPMMMKFTTQEFLKLGVPKDKIWVSFERNMSCALGKCGHCRIDETYICLEGPVFNYTKAETLLD